MFFCKSAFIDIFVEFICDHYTAEILWRCVQNDEICWPDRYWTEDGTLYVYLGPEDEY